MTVKTLMMRPDDCADFLEMMHKLDEVLTEDGMTLHHLEFVWR